MTPLQAAMNDPHAVLELVLGSPLHPGGHEGTDALLDRAHVTEGTRLVDLGCGAGDAVAMASDRGARAVGLDRAASAPGQIRGVLQALPFQDGCFDVALSECVLCLAEDLDQAIGQAHRVLAPGGRLALSDVTLTRELDHVPTPIAQALCLTGQRDPATLVDRIEAHGFAVASTRDHREDLLAMRDRLRSRVDVDGLLGAMGASGQALLKAAHEIEEAIEAGHLGYVSLVAEKQV